MFVCARTYPIHECDTPGTCVCVLTLEYVINEHAHKHYICHTHTNRHTVVRALSVCERDVFITGCMLSPFRWALCGTP